MKVIRNKMIQNLRSRSKIRRIFHKVKYKNSIMGYFWKKAIKQYRDNLAQFKNYNGCKNT